MRALCMCSNDLGQDKYYRKIILKKVVIWGINRLFIPFMQDQETSPLFPFKGYIPVALIADLGWQ